VTGKLSQPRPSYPVQGPARRQPAGPGTRLFETELGARSVQIIPICLTGAGSDEIAGAVQNSGYFSTDGDLGRIRNVTWETASLAYQNAE
jgi:hypothetical protein